MKSSSTLSHVLKYTGIFGGVQSLTILINVVRSKFATKFLGAAGFGMMGIYINIAEFIHHSTNFGIPFSSVRSMSELFASGTEDEQRHFAKVVRTWCFWTALLAVAVCVAGAPLLGLLFKMDGAWHIGLLTPMVFSTAITAGELSILKGMRRLKRVATISLAGAVSTLCITISIFWALGSRGIILALDASCLAMMAINLGFTITVFPYRIALRSRQVFHEGLSMVRIGIPYVLAGIAGAGMGMLLPAMLLHYGTQEDVGFYRAGYALMVTYAGIVFTAFEADFFPRLSSVCRDIDERNHTINQQIRVCVLLIAPLLIGLVTAMPLALHILYAKEFQVVAPMAICAAFYMFIRGITTPIAYTALACGDSMIYLMMEVVYDVVSVALIVMCYHVWGLMGAGIGLSASAIFDLLLTGICYGIHYHYRINQDTIKLAICQAILLAIAVAACMSDISVVTRYTIGGVLFTISALYSFRTIKRAKN